MVMMMMIVQIVFFNPSCVGTFASWVVALTGQARRCSAAPVARGGPITTRNACNACTATKLKQLRRGAPDQPRPLKRWRTSEVQAEGETAVTETPWQTLSVRPITRQAAHQGVLKEREIQLFTRPPCSIFTSGKSGKRHWERASSSPSLSCAPRSCVRCQLSTQKPLKSRAPLGSFTDAWRACAPEAAISSTACDGPAHMHAFFFSGLVRPVLKHGPKSLIVAQVFLWVLNLQAP